VGFVLLPKMPLHIMSLHWTTSQHCYNYMHCLCRWHCADVCITLWFTEIRPSRHVQLYTVYDTLWDIKFQTLKSQLLTFGACARPIAQSLWTMFLFLGCWKWNTLACNTCTTDVFAVFRKFYGEFNDIMSVLGYSQDEMSTLHIVRTYCLRTLMYGCEAWSLSNTNLHKLDVA